MLINADLAPRPGGLREVVSAGEPLNPEVIEQVRAAWGLTIRDGFGQTETTAQVGNTPGADVRLGSMGRPLPGVPVVLVDPVTGERVDGVGEGEICLDLAAQPLPLMTGYQGDAGRNAEAMAGGYYHTGDVASRDADGYITYIGRTDDVFKASDYKISPFELESVLIEHPAVAEAAVVPAPGRRTARRAEGLHRPRAGARARRRDRAVHPRATRASTSRRTSGCAGSSSSSCPRPSRARSGGSTCGPASSSPTASGTRRPSGATTSSPSSRADPDRTRVAPGTHQLSPLGPARFEV